VTDQADRVTVRMFGSLHALCREQGRATTLDAGVPAEGMTARALAEQLELPLDMIEGVFCNGHVYGLGHVIRPGDRVGFVPHGTPGPHRFFLGLYAAGKEDQEES